MVGSLSRKTERACRDDHPLHLRRTSRVVAERSPVDPIDLTRQWCPSARLHLCERPQDLHARLRELGLELLQDRLVEVPAIPAVVFVAQHLVDLDTDGE